MSFQKPRSKKFFSGFTLVELIVVVTILAILATVGFLALSGYAQDAKDSAIKANVRSVQTAITSEAAVTNNSPRYYVVHDADYALTWAFAYVDWTGKALTGGTWNVADTNYSAGNPDYVKLKLNKDKFRVSGLGATAYEAMAAYDGKSLMSAWADFMTAWTNGKKRVVSYVQTAGISPATKIASVAGNFPSTGMPGGYVSGLLRAEPGSVTNLTGALTDGGSSNVPSTSAPTSILLPTDASTVYSITSTGVNFSNTHGNSSILTGSLVTPLCAGNFSLSFKAEKIGQYTGFMGTTVVDSTNANVITSGYKTLVEQAWYSSWGVHIMRRMTAYAYTNGPSSGPIEFTVTRVGNVITGTATGYYTATETLASSPAGGTRALVYYIKNTPSGGDATGTVGITDVVWNCD